MGSEAGDAAPGVVAEVGACREGGLEGGLKQQKLCGSGVGVGWDGARVAGGGGWVGGCTPGDVEGTRLTQLLAAWTHVSIMATIRQPAQAHPLPAVCLWWESAGGCC